MKTSPALCADRWASTLLRGVGAGGLLLGLLGTLLGVQGALTGLGADPVLHPIDPMTSAALRNTSRVALPLSFFWATVGAQLLLALLSASLLMPAYGLLRQRPWARRGARLWCLAALALYLPPMALTVGRDIIAAQELGAALVAAAAVLTPASVPLGLLSLLALCPQPPGAIPAPGRSD